MLMRKVRKFEQTSVSFKLGTEIPEYMFRFQTDVRLNGFTLCILYKLM